VSRRSAARDADFTAFMGQSGPALLRTAWLLTGDHHRAQELTQAALVKTTSRGRVCGRVKRWRTPVVSSSTTARTCGARRAASW